MRVKLKGASSKKSKKSGLDTLDVDECSSETENNCDLNADCENTIGSFTCHCRPGFYGSGQNCDRGQCSDTSCPENEVCVSPTKTKCKCPKNFKKIDASCTDIDECGVENACDVNAKCTNFLGGHVCECLDGFYGNGTKCFAGDCPNQLCPINEECVSPRTLDCDCRKGYERNETFECTDLDECLTKEVRAFKNDLRKTSL